MSFKEGKIFFNKLRKVVANVNQEVEEIQKKIECSKYELPENSAILKLVEVKESLDSIKDASHKISEELQERNARFFQYHQHVEELGTEMDDKMSAIEDYLSGFGYKKFPGKYEEPPEVSEQKNETEPAMICYQTPLKGIMKTQTGTTGKENRIVHSVKNTPMLIDYGLQSKFTNCISEQKVDEESSVKSIRKRLRFRTPLSTISSGENISMLKYPINEEEEDDDDDTFEITEEFRNKICIAGTVCGDHLRSTKQKFDDAFEKVIPETPNIPSCRKKILIEKQVDDIVTPDEPTILSCRKANLIQSQTPCASTPVPPALSSYLSQQLISRNCLTPHKAYATDDNATPDEPTVLSCRKANLIQSQTENEDSPVDPCPMPSSVYVPCESSTPEPPVLRSYLSQQLISRNCSTPHKAYATVSQSSTPEEPVLTSSLKELLRKK